jgi:TPR repeat protein
MYSQFNLAEIYEKGTGGIEINLKEAIKLYKAAAKQKHKPAVKALKRLKIKK